jgi:hypothetical protein
MIPRRLKRPKMNVRESSRIESRAHLQWIRGCKCVMASLDCAGDIEAAHIRNGTDGGMGQKPSDCYVVALCRHHHARQHAVGEQTFWAGRDPLKIAAELWRISPARIKYEDKRKDRA